MPGCQLWYQKTSQPPVLPAARLNPCGHEHEMWGFLVQGEAHNNGPRTGGLPRLPLAKGLPPLVVHNQGTPTLDEMPGAHAFVEFVFFLMSVWIQKHTCG